MKVWDLPIRLFHWLLAALIVFSWWAHEDHLDWHRLSGFAIAGLLVFRLWWGLAGSSTARFSGFLKSPAGVLAYLRGAAAGLGHNPLGGWSVVAMLATLTLQVGLGLFAIDQDGFESGPLSRFVDFETGRLAAAGHGLVFNLLVGLIVLHLLAIGWYGVRRKNLVGPMITGRTAPADGGPDLQPAPAWKLLIGLALGLATSGGLYMMERASSL
ncbi:MAG: Ni/Fe-hydrogenase 1 b-type cytochrome subunit [Caulobacteraceae bacterium]|nr:Ni/Fe-hydrogenase 1 b-type cytochrome subunit [Caulobacteraceae bacterium]